MGPPDRAGVSARRARFNKVLFIDARGLGHMVRAPTASCPPKTSAASPMPATPDGGEDADFKPYEDVPGFRAAADLDAIRDHNHVLIPGQCVGS